MSTVPRPLAPRMWPARTVRPKFVAAEHVCAMRPEPKDCAARDATAVTRRKTWAPNPRLGTPCSVDIAGGSRQPLAGWTSSTATECRRGRWRSAERRDRPLAGPDAPAADEHLAVHADGLPAGIHDAHGIADPAHGEEALPLAGGSPSRFSDALRVVVRDAVIDARARIDGAEERIEEIPRTGRASGWVFGRVVLRGSKTRPVALAVEDEERPRVRVGGEVDPGAR